MTNTAAKFGAKQIGGWRQGTIFDGDAFNYISHKIMHGALAAATSAATARLDHVKGPERRKRIMGAASGAMMAEAVSEYMMHGALAKVEAQLNTSGHAPTSQAYADLRSELMKAELRQIKMFAQLAVAASAEAMRFDLNAAMFAANNALENNFSYVWNALAFGAGIGAGIWSACEICDTYRTEGPEAALIQAGVEVAVTVGGVKVFKVAGRAYVTAEAAWGAYLLENPRMAAIAEYCVEQGSKAKGFALEQGAKLADYVKFTGAGKFVSSINAKVEAKFAQWFGNAEAGAAAGDYERYWTKFVEFKGNKVYQRDDLFDPKFVDKAGRTNIQRMLEGKAPIGIDGKSLELHHMLQTQDGAIAELTSTFHKQYHSTIHINPPTMPSGINRGSFGTWRESYWIDRAKRLGETQ